MSTLDQEERGILASLERGEWKSVRDAKVLRRYVESARRTLRKNRRINIRLSQYDLDALQMRALQEGIPYQTLVTSVLHRYVSGRLKAA